MKLYFIKTTNKKEFLRSERNDDIYWLDFPYAEFLRTMESDAIKCGVCGIYSWDGCKLRCNCK